MNFQNLQKIHTADRYLDNAFRSTTKYAKHIQEKRPKIKDNWGKFRYAQYIEIERIEHLQEELTTILQKIHTKFPSLDSLPPFYNALAKVTIKYQVTKHALGSVKWAEEQCKQITKDAKIKIKLARTGEAIKQSRKQVYGRLGSIFRQINKHLIQIDTARMAMKRWPDIKPEMHTIAIAGYPNVGKSSLLRALTATNPEIKAYAFTTKALNVGYMEVEPRIYQLIDTPGAFDRPMEEMNPIEKEAMIVLEHVAEKIIYMFDPSESCGYEVELQLELAKRIKKLFNKPTEYVANKMDLNTAKYKKIQNLFPYIQELSLKDGKGSEEVKKMVQV